MCDDINSVLFYCCYHDFHLIRLELGLFILPNNNFLFFYFLNVMASGGFYSLIYITTHSPQCLDPIPRKLNNSWMSADLSHLLSVDKIMFFWVFIVVFQYCPDWPDKSPWQLRSFAQLEHKQPAHVSREFCYSTTALPPSHHGWIQTILSKIMKLAKFLSCDLKEENFFALCHIN